MNADECSKYWIERGVHAPKNTLTKEEYDEMCNINILQEKAIDKILDTINWNSLIEVGCGYGRHIIRNKKRYPNKKIIGVDISIEKLNQIKKLNLDIELIECDVFETIPKINIDVALTSEFMMHIPPENLLSLYNRIKEMSNKIIMLEYCVPSKFNDTFSEHNWNHDYIKILDDLDKIEIKNTPDCIFKNWK